MIRLNLGCIDEPLAQVERTMQSMIVCVHDPQARSTLQAAAGLMGVECTVMSLDLLFARRGVLGDWIIADCGPDDCFRLGAYLSRAGVNPRLTIIRLINQVWQSYVYHDLPVYASLVLPDSPEAAAHLLTRMRHASAWARDRLRQDWDPSRSDVRPADVELGESPAMLVAMEMASRVAGLPVDILIRGETGTGKDTFARWVHHLSRRKGQFVHINCAALPEQLIESELFGVEAGAFTGAMKTRIGKLEYAHEGTLYLDEIDSMPIIAQAKLLRALQDRGAERLGGHRFIACDFRVIASTKLDLVEMVEQGRFRQDLLFRLNVVEIFLPPLRARQVDIPLLFSHFCKQAAQRFKVELPPADPALLAALKTQPWPGNVRELKAYAERHVLGLQSLPPSDSGADAGQAAASGLPLKQALRRYEKRLIENALRQHAGSVRLAASALGTTPHALYYRMKQLGLKVRDADAPETAGENLRGGLAESAAQYADGPAAEEAREGAAGDSHRGAGRQSVSPEASDRRVTAAPEAGGRVLINSHG